MPSSSSILASEPSQKIWPTTDACWRTRRSAGESESRRAASTAWTVSGSVWTSWEPSSRIRLTISSANSGIAAGALGHLRHELPGPVGSGAVAAVGEQGGDQFAGLVAGKRLERDRRRVAPAAAPSRAAVEELVAGQADDQRRPAHPAGEVLDQVEHSLVRPVDVLDASTTGRGGSRPPPPSARPRTGGRASAAGPPTRAFRSTGGHRPAARCRAGRAIVAAIRSGGSSVSASDTHRLDPAVGASSRPARSRRCRRSRTGPRMISPSAQ